MCLVEGLGSILRHVLRISPKLYKACPSAEEKAGTWLAILRRFMRQQLLDGREKGNSELLEVPWHLTRMIASFAPINVRFMR